MIQLAFAYEQATKHRRAPAFTIDLPSRHVRRSAQSDGWQSVAAFREFNSHQVARSHVAT